MHRNYHCAHPIELRCQLSTLFESLESPAPSQANQPSTSTTHPLPDISKIAKDLQNLKLQAYMQNNPYITGCIVCGKPYDQMREKRVDDFLQRTVEPNQTIRERILKDRAFLGDLQCGAFTFVSRDCRKFRPATHEHMISHRVIPTMKPAEDFCPYSRMEVTNETLTCSTILFTYKKISSFININLL